jgi:hypothetical protein
MTVVKQQVQKLCEEFCSELQVTSHDVEVTWDDIEVALHNVGVSCLEF